MNTVSICKTKWLQFRTTLLVVGVCVILTTPTLISFVRAVNNIGLFPPRSSKPYGLTYGEWTAKWFHGQTSIPKKDNPIADTTGVDCGLNQNGPVWFLTGTFGGSAERTCSMPAGTAILFPVSNADCSYSENPNLKTESDLRSCAISSENQVTSAQATFDGINLQWVSSTHLHCLTSPSLAITSLVSRQAPPKQ